MRVCACLDSEWLPVLTRQCFPPVLAPNHTFARITPSHFLCLDDSLSFITKVLPDTRQDYWYLFSVSTWPSPWHLLHCSHICLPHSIMNLEHFCFLPPLLGLSIHPSPFPQMEHLASDRCVTSSRKMSLTFPLNVRHFLLLGPHCLLCSYPHHSAHHVPLYLSVHAYFPQ